MLIQNCYTAVKVAILQKLHFRVNCREIGIKAARLLRANEYTLNDIQEITRAQVTRQERGWIKSPCMYAGFPFGK